jgi:hypothetical protein
MSKFEDEDHINVSTINGINLALKQTDALSSAYEDRNPDFSPERDVPQARGHMSPVPTDFVNEE